MMKKKPVLMDGAVGTSLWEKADASGYPRTPVWMYNREHPELVRALCREYVEAGSQILLTNTFGANSPSVKRSSPYSVEEIVTSAVKLAREEVAGTDVKLALAIGPLSMLMEPYGDLTEEEAAAIFDEMMGFGVDAGVNLIYLQTFMDLEMMRVAAETAKNYRVPVFCTMTFEKRGKTMMGNSVADTIETLEPLGIDAIGMNCSLGPDLALPVIREFVGKTELPLIFKPNAGKPILSSDGSEAAAYNSEAFVRETAPALEFVDYIGGCCGCNPSYIRALNERMRNDA